MIIYLDNCCFNRPYDYQLNEIIKLESEAKIIIQTAIKNKSLKLIWSYILEYENSNNPYQERKMEILKWKDLSECTIMETDNILQSHRIILDIGIKALDALHIACAIEGQADYFITVDKGILKKAAMIDKIKIIDPINFLYKWRDND